MRDIFNQELKQLGSDLETMARQVATAIERAAESLSNGDIIIAEQVIDAVLMGRFLERFGDHSTSVARRMAYLVSGGAPG